MWNRIGIAAILPLAALVLPSCNGTSTTAQRTTQPSAAIVQQGGGPSVKKVTRGPNSVTTSQTQGNSSATITQSY